MMALRWVSVSIFLILAISASLSSSRARAEESGAANSKPANTLTDKEKADGWRLLFDGKSMDQFRRYNADAITDKWRVVEGALVLSTPGGGDIVTKEKFDSF